MGSRVHHGLRGAILTLLGHLAEAVVLRAELASLEFAEERRRLLSLLAWLALGGVAVVMALLCGSLFIVVAFWDHHRLVATAAVGGCYLLLAVIAGWRLRQLVVRPPPAFARTVGVLRKDYESIFAGGPENE